MLLLELLGIDAAPGRSKYHRTGKATGRPNEHKLRRRPTKDLWFNDKALWHRDVSTTRERNFKMLSSENEEVLVACDLDGRMAYGKWDANLNKGIGFHQPRPIYTVISPKTNYYTVS